ncbi:MAG: type II secretion system minor pseudopilin GspK [Steroidobacteraceae bacterium]
MRQLTPLGRARQGGIALLTAVVLVALATVVATAIAFDTTLAARRGGGAAAYDEAQQLTVAAEAIAAAAISRNRQQANAAIHGGQDWAQPFGPLEVMPGHVLAAGMIDLQGRFNLNNLTKADGKINTEAVEVFRRLLENVGLESDWAVPMADWIDEDLQVEPGGAEDGVYTSETPGYRPPNRVITNPTEMLALHDFGLERWSKIAPYVTALPRGTAINLCTAPGELLDALTHQHQWTGSPDALQRNRAGKCFPDQASFDGMFADPAARQKLAQALPVSEISDWFQLRTLATIGTSDFALYSLLHYQPGPGGGGGRVRVLGRTFTE